LFGDLVIAAQRLREETDEVKIDEGPDGDYLPAQDAARACGLTLPQISKLCKEGKVKSRKPNPEQREGKEKLQVHVADLVRYLAEAKRRKDSR
jgi:hypothetical protein